MTFQSRFGKQVWLQPYTDEVLENLASDGINNVLDVVSLVNCVLGDGCDICAGDMNQDEILNVLDVVLLVNSILG